MCVRQDEEFMGDALIKEEFAMWWEKKNRPAAPLDLETVTLPSPTSKMETPMNEATTRVPSTTATPQHQTVLGRTVVLHGQLSASEDLLIEGQFEGTVTLEEHRLTVGAAGQVKAEIRARQVVVMGTVSGNVSAKDKIDIRRTGHVLGDLKAGTVAIEEGAYFKGSVDILRDESPEGSHVASAHSGRETSA
jgi:cytoskeletal protein CcmA (bactofilin family)